VRYLRQSSRALFMLLIAFGTAVTVLTWAAPTTLAAGPADPQAKELVRLINGERAYHGLRALKVDSFLAGKARDGVVTCPNDATLTMAGRAKDFAVYGYPSNSHRLRLCPSYSAMDAMKKWGYNTYRGEVTALNGGYGTAAHAYTYGCTPSLRTCPGTTTSSFYTSVRAVTNWMSSATHYAVLMGNYDRIGCGAWIGSSGTYFYDCMVSRGGRTVPRTSTKSTTTRVAGATATPTPSPTASPSPTGTPFIEVFTPPPGAGVEETPEPTPTAAALPVAGGSGSDPDIRSSAPASPPARSRDVSVAAGLGTAVVSLIYWLVFNRRKRRGAAGAHVPI